MPSIIVGMFDMRKYHNSHIKVRNGKLAKITNIGKLWCKVEQLNGGVTEIIMNNIYGAPDMKFSLFSLTKAISSGAKLKILEA